MATAPIAAEPADRSWRPRLREAAVPTFAGAAALAASLANFLNHNQYPLLRPEVGILAAVLLAAVLLMGLLYVASGRIVRTILQILLVYLALDLNFDGYVVPIAAVAVAIALQGRAMPFIAVAASVVLLTILTGVATAERGMKEALRGALAEHRTDLPVLVHLILDEHIGIEGLRDGTPEATEMHEELKRFYLDRGFRLFGGAYSEHIRTVNAIPQLLNFGQERPWNPSDRIQSTLSSNAYFDRLGEEGYQILVSQTDYMDYCRNDFVVHCSTRRAAELASVADAPIPASDKAYIVAAEFTKLSVALHVPAAIYHHMAHPAQVLAIPPLGPLATFDRLAGQLRDAAPGNMHFVHELLPHTPYALSRDCRLKTPSEWKSQLGGPRKDRMTAYLDQIACLNARLDAIFDAAGRDAIIVVQGDHGSRITEIEPKVETIGHFGNSDLIAGHSTIFAVRASGIESGYDRRALPVAEILRQLAASGFRSARISVAPDFVPTVVLEDSDWKPTKRHPLPKGWPSAAAH